MILVDTSVLIQFLRGESNDKVESFMEMLTYGIPFGISAYTYAEVLQGARNEAEYAKLDEYLSSQTIYEPQGGVALYREAATVYYRLRKKGVTLRGLVDILIALTAVQRNLYLLHRDRDYEKMKTAIDGLKTM